MAWNLEEIKRGGSTSRLQQSLPQQKQAQLNAKQGYLCGPRLEPPSTASFLTTSPEKLAMGADHCTLIYSRPSSVSVAERWTYDLRRTVGKAVEGSGRLFRGHPQCSTHQEWHQSRHLDAGNLHTWS